MQIDQSFWETARQKHEQGLISIKESGDGLSILCYTEDCNFGRQWDDFLLQCRGLVVSQDRIVARSFRKFFNLNEIEETKIENLPLEKPEVVEKLDGSIGILYRWNGRYGVASKTSFHSDQAKWATRFFNEHYSHLPWPEEYTFVFEIIYPANKVIVDYGSLTGLSLIGAVHTETGKEWSHKELTEWALEHEIPVARMYDHSVDELLEIRHSYKATQLEGWVLHYPNDLRVKIKTADYLKLMKLVTKVSPRAILRSIAIDKNYDDVFANYHPELQSDVDFVYDFFLKIVNRQLETIQEMVDRAAGLAPMERVALAQELPGYLQKAFFKSLKGQDVRYILWQKLYDTRLEYREEFLHLRCSRLNGL